MKKLEAGKYTFEVVEAVPSGFKVWNIPEDTIPGYLPLCENLPGSKYDVNPETLKAVKVDGIREIKRAAMLGYSTKDKVLKGITKLENKKNKPKTLAILKAARPYFEGINWE